MTNTWTSIDPTLPEGIAGVCAAMENSALAERATLYSDPRWVMALAGNGEKRPCIYVLDNQPRMAGLATFLFHPSSAFQLSLGELTFFSRPVQRMDALAPPLTDARDAGEEKPILVELFSQLKRELDGSRLLFFEGVREGSAMFDLASDPRLLKGKYHVLPHGKIYRHHFAAIPGSLDEYLKLLSARTRADLRTNRKRFIAHVKGHYHTKCFRTPEAVPHFLADAMAVSRKTWQYRLLAAGLRNSENLERLYLAATGLGWFRGYVLYAGEQPIAYQVGYVYKGRFHAHEIGYDPEWAPHHVGIFLHTEIIADLAVAGVKEFDFGNGDMLHKRRLATRSVQEAYFYFIPATVKGRLMAVSMGTTSRISSALGSILGRFGIRAKTRDFLRRVRARTSRNN